MPLLKSLGSDWCAGAWWWSWWCCCLYAWVWACSWAICCRCCWANWIVRECFEKMRRAVIAGSRSGKNFFNWIQFQYRGDSHENRVIASFSLVFSAWTVVSITFNTITIHVDFSIAGIQWANLRTTKHVEQQQETMTENWNHWHHDRVGGWSGIDQSIKQMHGLYTVNPLEMSASQLFSSFCRPTPCVKSNWFWSIDCLWWRWSDDMETDKLIAGCAHNERKIKFKISMFSTKIQFNLIQILSAQWWL